MSDAAAAAAAASSENSTIGSGIIVGLATICVALRFFTRIFIKVGIGWDDWWILIGLLLMLLTCGFLMWGDSVDPTANGVVGYAIDNMKTTNFDTSNHYTYFKLSFVATILYYSIVTSIKISILLMYRRIFAVNASFRQESLVVGAIVLAFWVAATIATVLNCWPIEYNWLAISPQKFCFNYNVFWMVTGATEIMIDAIILALPMRMVLRLQLSIKHKISILLVFLLGGFVVVTGVVRVIYSYIPGSRAPSFTKSQLWSVLHIGIAIICACLPPIRPLVARTSKLITVSHPSLTSTVRQRYYDMRGQYAKGTDHSRNSRMGDAIEIQPLKHLDGGSNGADLKDPRVNAVYLKPDMNASGEGDAVEISQLSLSAERSNDSLNDRREEVSEAPTRDSLSLRRDESNTASFDQGIPPITRLEVACVSPLTV